MGDHRPTQAAWRSRASRYRFYLLMAVASTALITVGFSRSYYLKLHYPASPVLSPLVHLHAAVFTAWMLYFVLQTALIGLHRPALHRRLGLIGAVLGRIVGFGVPVPAIALLDLAFLFAGPVYDLLTRRRIHPVYIYGCLFALATFPPLRFAVGATPWWHRVAHLVAGM